MIYCGISLLVNTRRLEIILKYFNFIKSLERNTIAENLKLKNKI